MDLAGWPTKPRDLLASALLSAGVTSHHHTRLFKTVDSEGQIQVLACKASW